MIFADFTARVRHNILSHTHRDTVVSSPNVGDLLTWHGADWRAQAPPSGLVVTGSMRTGNGASQTPGVTITTKLPIGAPTSVGAGFGAASSGDVSLNLIGAGLYVISFEIAYTRNSNVANPSVLAGVLAYRCGNGAPEAMGKTLMLPNAPEVFGEEPLDVMTLVVRGPVLIDVPLAGYADAAAAGGINVDLHALSALYYQA